MVTLLYTASGELIVPDPSFIYCPGDEKGTREVRAYLQRVRDEILAEERRLKERVLERIRTQPSTEREEGT